MAANLRYSQKWRHFWYCPYRHALANAAVPKGPAFGFLNYYYKPYLGAIRGEHVRAAARSIGAALIEKPVLEANRCSREGNSSEMG